MPLPAFAIVAAPAAFAQAEMWNTVPMQLATWATLLVLVDFARAGQGGVRYWSVLVVVVCVVAQVIFLTRSHDLRRRWDLTEYREAIIALLCLFYAFCVYQVSKRRNIRVIS